MAHRQESFRQAFVAAACAVVMSCVAASAAPQGYWAISEAPDGIKLGVIFPDYSPNEFAGLGFLCTPGVETVQGWSDVGAGLKNGAKAPLVIAADASRARYVAKIERSEMDDGLRAQFLTALADPLFDDLAKAKTLKVGVGARSRDLPLRGGAKAVTEFLTKCRAGGE